MNLKKKNLPYYQTPPQLVASPFQPHTLSKYKPDSS